MGALNLINQIPTHIQTEIDPFLVDANDARLAIDYVNTKVDASDLVIASPAIAWGIDSHVADFQMVAAAQGRTTPHIPADLPASRYVRKPDYATARYIVVDNTWRTWAIFHVEGVAEILLALNEWPQVLGTGEVVVYCNAQKYEC